jgi:orotidine-5'-phosphate decarboxylase
MPQHKAGHDVYSGCHADDRHGAGDGVMDPRDRLIVALDVPSVAAAAALVEKLGDAVSFYKIGYQLAFSGGLSFADTLIRGGKKIFVDLKLHDIGNTVAKGVESVAKLGAAFLTVHAYPQTMHAAVDARRGSGLRILAVTVLTSYDDADLAAAGYDFTVPELVAERAAQARDIGVDGLVCSAEEAASLRGIAGGGMVLVTPGIRPAGADKGDQKRIMTPSAAITAGSDYLVVGRPILAAEDPKAAASAIISEIAGAAR